MDTSSGTLDDAKATKYAPFSLLPHNLTLVSVQSPSLVVHALAPYVAQQRYPAHSKKIPVLPAHQFQMRCVGAEDGQKCQRCKRANVELVAELHLLISSSLTPFAPSCIFEKHRRGRKPGSKYSLFPTFPFIMLTPFPGYLRLRRCSVVSKKVSILQR